jgi:hypothetical protein
MKYYYANTQNQPVGPVEIAELQRLLGEKVISPSTNVIAEGGTAWMPAYSVLPGLKREPVSLGATFRLPTFLADLVGKALNGVRNLVGSATYGRWMQFFNKTGQMLILVGAIVGFLYSIVFGIKTNQFSLFVGGILVIIGLGLLQFVAKHFLKGCEQLIANTPTRISSTAVLDSFALLLLFATLGALFGAIVGAILGNSFSVFLTGLVFSILFFVGAVVALNPNALAITVEEASAGEEAVGVMSFFLKGGLAVLPVIFALTALAGTVALVFGFFSDNPSLGYEEFGLFNRFVPNVLSNSLASLGVGSIGFGILILAAFIPLVAYLWFLAMYLPIDLAAALFRIPRKLDSLRH